MQCGAWWSSFCTCGLRHFTCLSVILFCPAFLLAVLVRALLKEVVAYTKMEKLWGVFVPQLVGYGTTSNGRVVFVATELLKASDLEKVGCQMLSILLSEFLSWGFLRAWAWAILFHHLQSSGKLVIHLIFLWWSFFRHGEVDGGISRLIQTSSCNLMRWTYYVFVTALTLTLWSLNFQIVVEFVHF
jgi:hypothetical protein